jgi:hypothetical protein
LIKSGAQGFFWQGDRERRKQIHLERRQKMTTKKVLGLVIFLLGAGTLAYLAMFKVGSGMLGVGGGIAAIVGYALLFGFSTGRKAIAGDGK